MDSGGDQTKPAGRGAGLDGRGVRGWLRRLSLRRRIAVFTLAFVVVSAVAIAAVPPLRLVAMHFALSRVTLLHYEIDGTMVEVEGAVNGRSVGQFTKVLDHPAVDTVRLAMSPGRSMTK